MNYSTNYSMREPVPGEKVKVADINYNTEIIDGVMLDNRQISIDMYDDTSTYNTDDLAGHENSSGRIAVYRCLQDNTTGAWDDTKWVQTNLADEITDIRGNAGASDLGDLNDVDLTNPTEGQVLTYDEQNDEWVNSDLPDADVTKEASGNPIEFSDGADAPLVKCVTEIQGSQDLHGYDKPWVGGAGKNKLVTPTLAELQTANTGGTWSGNNYELNGITFVCHFGEDGLLTHVDQSGTATSQATLFFKTFSGLNGDYIFSGGIAQYKYITYKLNGAWSSIYTQTGETNVSFSSSDNIQIVIAVNSGQTGTGTFYPMFRLSTVTDSTFAPYSNICPITAYTEGEIEVRGKNLISGYAENKSINSSGNITADNGACISNKIKVVPSTTYTLSYIKTISLLAIHCYGANDTYLGYVIGQVTSPYTFSYSTLKPNTKEVIIQWNQSQQGNILPTNGQLESGSTATPYEPFVAPTTHTTTFPSAIYRGSEDVVNGEVSYTWGKFKIGASSLTWAKYDVAQGTMFRAYLNINPQSVIYAMPNVISSHYASVPNAQRTNGTVSQAPGLKVIDIIDNRFTTVEDFVRASADVELCYEYDAPQSASVTPTNLPIKSLSGYNHIESSTGDMDIEYFPAKEQPLIDLIQSSQHVYSTQEQVVGKWVDGKDVYEKTYVFSSLPSVNDWTAFDEDCGIDTLVDYSLMFTRSNGQIDNDSDELRVAYNPPTGLGDLCYYPGGVEATHITVRYTKTSSNNRSLAKSAPETKKEQVEELKEEPTEETKEEPEEVKEEPVEEVKEEETKEEGEVNER